MIHWVQDFVRVSNTPDIDDLDEAYFRAALGVSSQRSTIRKQEAKDASSASSKASPGKLKDDRKWNEWITRFKNMLSMILGVNGVPLSYVVRENPKPKPKGHDTFVQKCIACAPLTGPHFDISEQWIKMHARKQNGRIDLEAVIIQNEWSIFGPN